MIVDLSKFIRQERPYWAELESRLDKLESDELSRQALPELQRFHYLYERTAADLARLVTFSTEPELRRYLESLVARAYGQVHETRARRHRFNPWNWFFQTLPRAFRRHAGAFYFSCAVTLAGMLFGGVAVAFDPEAKWAIVPAQFAHLMENPSDRVRQEEAGGAGPRDSAALTTFSAQLMTNNIGVAIKALAWGMAYGIGTLILLFYNGIILGLVGIDYIQAGETIFLMGWLLPHGSIEIPAILIGGQTGLILAGALIGWGQRLRLRQRLRLITSDLVTLIGGVAVLLVWAGLVEAFFSQYHAPVIPYSVKIGFGALQLVLLALFFWRSGRFPEPESNLPALSTSPPLEEPPASAKT